MKTPKNLSSGPEKKLIIFFLFLSIGIGSFAHAFENQHEYRERQFDLLVSGSYFKTDGNYNSGGSKEALPGGFSYQLIDANIRPRFVFLENWALFGSLNVGTSESKDNIKTLTNSTMNWASIGTDYRWLHGDFNLYSDLEVIIPFEKVSTTMDTSLNWDGAIHVRPRVLGEFIFGTFVPYGYAGLDWRDKGLSTLALFGGGLRFDFAMGMQLGFELNGYTSIKDDQYTDRVSERESIISNFNANSKKFYSINPSALDTDIYFKYRFSPNWQMGVTGGLTLSGSQMASGYHGGGFVKFSFGEGARSSPVHNHTSEMDREINRPAPQPHKEFQEDTEDGVDQQYFNAVPAVRPAPPASSPPANSNPTSSSGGPEDYQIQLKKMKVKKRK